MKYRLLKDLPGVKAGTEIRFHSTMNGVEYWFPYPDGIDYPIPVAIKNEWLEEIKEEPKIQTDTYAAVKELADLMKQKKPSERIYEIYQEITEHIMEVDTGDVIRFRFQAIGKYLDEQQAQSNKG